MRQPSRILLMACQNIGIIDSFESLSLDPCFGAIGHGCPDNVLVEGLAKLTVVSFEDKTLPRPVVSIKLFQNDSGGRAFPGPLQPPSVEDETSCVSPLQARFLSMLLRERPLDQVER